MKKIRKLQKSGRRQYVHPRPLVELCCGLPSGFEACTPAAVASHVDGHDGSVAYSAFLAEIIHRDDVGIHAVFEMSHLVLLTFGQEVELELQVAFAAVGDSADKPLVALALCYHAVLACFGCYDACLVPIHRHACEEVAAVGPLVVAAGIVHQHLQVAFEEHEDGHVEHLSAYSGADGPVAAMAFGLVVEHGAWCVVHRSDGIADEGQPDCVVRLAGTVVLHTTHSFIG